MKTPVRSAWGFVPFEDWASNPDNLFYNHSSRVALPTDEADLEKVVPGYEKPKTRPPWNLGKPK